MSRSRSKGGGVADWNTLLNKPANLTQIAALTFAEKEVIQSVAGSLVNRRNRFPNFVDTATYPLIGTYAGTVRNCGDQTALIAAIAAAGTGDIIMLTADITLTATLVINKSIKLDGAFILQSAGAAGDPVTLISVTAAGVYITDKVTIKHRKTVSTSVEVAVNTAALNFVSYANVEFMEFGYVLRGSFNISGKTTYTGPLGNNHRHVAIYNVAADSKVDGVIYDFISEATPRSIFILVSAGPVTDKFLGTLKVSNNFMADETKVMRQFFIQEAFTASTDTTKPSIIFENNTFNEKNGAIIFYDGTGIPVLDFFDSIAVVNNKQGNASAGFGMFAGLVKIDGAGALHDMGSCKIYMTENIHPTTLMAGFTSLLDGGGVAYNNTLFTAIAQRLTLWLARYV